MKLNCNQLAIGSPGTQHINWESVSTFIASKTEAVIQSIFKRREVDAARRSKRPVTRKQV